VRIVVLDGYTTNSGDLSWHGLEALGPCTIHDRTPAALVAERIAGADIVLTNKTPLNADTIAAAAALRYIGVLASGTNVIDLAAARRRGVVVCNAPGYGTASVAQAVFAHILNLCNRTALHAASVSAGDWSRGTDFCYALTPQRELAGLTLGIVGYGKIGQAVGNLGRAFGMNILASGQRTISAPGVTGCPVDELFTCSDVISLHCPLSEQTRHLVNAARLARMRPTALLINTGRGDLVDEAALAAALNQGRIAGAGLDVLSTEPPAPGNPLLSATNCFITPHNAWATRAARERLLGIVIANIQAFVAGRAQNVIP
jgi:glycerate dehydrogenase